MKIWHADLAEKFASFKNESIFLTLVGETQWLEVSFLSVS